MSKIKIGDLVELTEIVKSSPYFNYVWEVISDLGDSFNVRDVTYHLNNNYSKIVVRKISIKRKRIKLLYNNYYK